VASSHSHSLALACVRRALPGLPLGPLPSSRRRPDASDAPPYGWRATPECLVQESAAAATTGDHTAPQLCRILAAARSPVHWPSVAQISNRLRQQLSAAAPRRFHGLTSTGVSSTTVVAPAADDWRRAGSSRSGGSILLSKRTRSRCRRCADSRRSRCSRRRARSQYMLRATEGGRLPLLLISRLLQSIHLFMVKAKVDDPWCTYGKQCKVIIPETCKQAAHPAAPLMAPAPPRDRGHRRSGQHRRARDRRRRRARQTPGVPRLTAPTANLMDDCHQYGHLRTAVGSRFVTLSEGVRERHKAEPDRRASSARVGSATSRKVACSTVLFITGPTGGQGGASARRRRALATVVEGARIPALAQAP
jgi:hypothetical protein